MIHDLSCIEAMSRHPEVTVQSAPQSSNPTKSQNSRCMAAIVVQFTYRILAAYAEPMLLGSKHLRCYNAKRC